MQWRSQEVINVRNVKHLSRKAAGSEQSQCVRKATWIANGKALQVGLFKPFRAYTMLVCVLDAGHEALGFNVCPVGFQSSFCPVTPFYVPTPSSLLEWEGLTIISWKYLTCFFILQGFIPRSEEPEETLNLDFSFGFVFGGIGV
jgi:hypothetical protein